MCGINGFSWGDTNLIKRMNKITSHRGPDDNGYWVNKHISLGNTRLSIQDLTERGHQPMENDRYVITFNGEIYNHMKLRNILKKRGINFESNSDTETILKAYSIFKDKLFSMMNGMWALAIYDKEKSILTISRDRIGIKPLYYYLDNAKDKIIFSSEIKSILLHDIKKIIKKDKILEILTFRKILNNETLFLNIFELPPSTYMKFKPGKIKIIQYYQISDYPYLRNSENYIAEKLLEKLKNSVNMRLISDAKIGSLLSGGLDSSIITLISEDTRDIPTYTVKFNKRNEDNDFYFARLLSELFSFKNKYIHVTFKRYTKETEEYNKHKDQPIMVANEVALSLLFRRIRSDGIKVILSGEGADELFFGYGRIFRSLTFIKKLDRRNLVSLFRNYYIYWKPSLIKLLDNKSKREVNRIIKNKIFESTKKIDKSSKYNFLMNWFIKNHITGLLNRIDSASMYRSVEVRVPFLDHEFIEFSKRINPRLKLKWKSKNYLEKAKKMRDVSKISETYDIPKYILKKVGEKIGLPKELVYRKKIGFAVPFIEWKNDIATFDFENILEEYKIFPKGYTDALYSSVKRMKNNYEIQFLWMIKSINIWLKYKLNNGVIIL